MSGCERCVRAADLGHRNAYASCASESTSLRFVGLAAGGIGTGPGDINFALRLQSGVAEVRESGAYKSDVRFAAGDTFAIAVAGGVVKYSKNGSVFYTSAVARRSRCARSCGVLHSQCSHSKCRHCPARPHRHRWSLRPPTR